MSYNSRSSVAGGQFNYWGNASPPISEPLYDSRYQNLPSDGSGGYNPLMPGTIFGPTYDGKLFQYVESGEAAAFAEGTVLAPVAFPTTTGTIASSTDKMSLTGFSGLTTDEWLGGYVYITAGTGEGQCRRIVHNSATVLYLERAMTTAVAAGTAVVYHPHRVRKAPTSGGITQLVSGVSVGVISAMTGSGRFVAGGVSYYGWVQVYGFCEKVLVYAAPNVGANLLVASTNTAGTAEALANGAAAEDQLVFGYVAHQSFGNNDVAIPAYITCGPR